MALKIPPVTTPTVELTLSGEDLAALHQMVHQARALGKLDRLLTIQAQAQQTVAEAERRRDEAVSIRASAEQAHQALLATLDQEAARGAQQRETIARMLEQSRAASEAERAQMETDSRERVAAASAEDERIRAAHLELAASLDASLDDKRAAIVDAEAKLQQLRDSMRALRDQMAGV